MALAATGNLGGFPAGTAYVTQGSTIFVVPPGGGSAVPMIISGPGAPLVAPHGHSGIQFDTQGAFGGKLIFTSSEAIWTIDKNGVATKIAAGVAPGTEVFIESPSVSPTGVLYVTVEDDSLANAGKGPLSGVYNLQGGSLVRVANFGGVKAPESINFVPAAACKLTIKGVDYGGFLSVYDQTGVGSLAPTTSIIDGFLFSDISAQAGKAILTFEYSGNSGVSTGPDLVVFDGSSNSVLGTFAEVDKQLEGFNLVTCGVPPPPGGCPATQGFWHKAGNWPTVNASVNVNGIANLIYNTNFSITIGGITYTQTQLLRLMPSGDLHSGNYANALSQFIAAVINIVAGAQHTVSGDAAIAAVNTALTGVPIFCGNNLCSVSASVSSVVQGNLSKLDDYNSAKGLGCTEGAGLKTGKGK